MSWLTAQRELVARYRVALAAYYNLPEPEPIDRLRFCNHFVEALGPIVWADDAGRPGLALDPDAAYREARGGSTEYDAPPAAAESSSYTGRGAADDERGLPCHAGGAARRARLP